MGSKPILSVSRVKKKENYNPHKVGESTTAWIENIHTKNEKKETEIIWVLR